MKSAGVGTTTKSSERFAPVSLAFARRLEQSVRLTGASLEIEVSGNCSDVFSWFYDASCVARQGVRRPYANLRPDHARGLRRE